MSGSSSTSSKLSDVQRISEAQRRTEPWATGKPIREVATGGCYEHYGVSVDRDELAAWLRKVEEEQLKKGKRK